MMVQAATKHTALKHEAHYTVAEAKATALLHKAGAAGRLAGTKANKDTKRQQSNCNFIATSLIYSVHVNHSTFVKEKCSTLRYRAGCEPETGHFCDLKG